MAKYNKSNIQILGYFGRKFESKSAVYKQYMSSFDEDLRSKEAKYNKSNIQILDYFGRKFESKSAVYKQYMSSFDEDLRSKEAKYGCCS